MSVDSDAATRTVIEQMIQMSRRAASSPVVIAAAAAAAGDSDDDQEIAARIFWWVKRRVAFVEDEEIWERCGLNAGADDELQDLLIAPDDLLQMPRPVGDCDDFAMLVCSLLIAAGIGCQLVVIAADREQPRVFSHVYVHALTQEGTMPLDASHGPFPGWEAHDFSRREIYDVFTTQSKGFGGIDWNSILNNTIGAATRVFEGRYSTPAVPPAGTYVSTGPQGSTIYRPNDGSVFPALVGSTTGGISSSTLLLVGLGVVALVLVSAVKK